MKWYTTFGEVSIQEQQFRQGSRRIRPFIHTAQVRPRSPSRPLQRAIVDFASDVSFSQAMDKLVEHYGVLLGESVLRRVTLKHSRQIGDWSEENRSKGMDSGPGEASVIAQMDGGMVPIVESNASVQDRRKGKVLYWKEAKLGLAHRKGSHDLVYGGTLQGGVNEAGEALFDCACRVGYGDQTEVHVVGDGATWISDQVERQFGVRGHYLVDFYHLCDYLGAAMKVIWSSPEERSSGLARQKQRLKAGQADQVLRELKPHLEAAKVEDIDAPVRRCYRYIKNRRHQLDYPYALNQGLPIGSGEIESAHRYVVQQRLKRPGSWWTVNNAQSMLALRLNRANRQWNEYWTSQMQVAA